MKVYLLMRVKPVRSNYQPIEVEKVYSRRANATGAAWAKVTAFAGSAYTRHDNKTDEIMIFDEQLENVYIIRPMEVSE